MLAYSLLVPVADLDCLFLHVTFAFERHLLGKILYIFQFSEQQFRVTSFIYPLEVWKIKSHF